MLPNPLSANDVEGPAPTCSAEEVCRDIHHRAQAITQAGLFFVIRRRPEGPIDKHWPAHDVLHRNKPPEAAVSTFGAMVTHGKDLTRRYYDVVALNVRWKILAPNLGQACTTRRCNGREVVAPWFIGILRVAVFSRHRGIWFTLGDAVHINHAVSQMNMVAGNADRSLHKNEVRCLRIRLEEDDDVAAFHGTIMHKRRP